MLGKSKKKGGFTLVELMIVVVTVGILAAVAISLYRGYAKKAIATEGAAGLGTLRTALRVVYAQHRDYSAAGTIDDTTNNKPSDIPGIDAGDLEGTYFHESDYTITSILADSFTITLIGTTGKKGLGVSMSITHEGEVTWP